MSIKVMIVDDEQKALDALAWQLSAFCPQVTVLDKCNSVDAAIASIRREMPDAVFLDIEMPIKNGFALLEYFHPLPFEIIFTTAYDQFAIKAIKMSALDYLLKPIDPADLQAAVRKLEEKSRTKDQQAKIELLLSNMLSPHAASRRLALPASEGLLFLEPAEIMRCEAESNYTKVFLKDGRKITVAKTLKDVEQLLDENLFFRVHHSHLVNTQFIQKMLKKDGGVLMMADGAEIAIARNRKDQFMEIFRKI